VHGKALDTVADKHPDVNTALVDRLCRYDALVEVGVGVRPSVAAGLARRGCRVVATDVHERSVPEAVRFVRDDVTDADPAVYRGADAVYALNCPPELQRPLADAAEAVGADCLFTTLGGDPTVVDAAPETISGDTLFRLNT
jgi:uncharacterized UPF0146 family protein